MSTFQIDPAILQRKARYESLVANWPEALQRASTAERQLLRLMRHPCYRLLVRVDETGVERLIVRPSPGKPSPLTDAARTHIRAHKAELIAWVKRTETDATRLRAALDLGRVEASQ